VYKQHPRFDGIAAFGAIDGECNFTRHS
jgi:hypothetical protein